MTKIKCLVYSAVCLALCMALPFLTGQIPQIGKALSPMHIPVFICGFVCGWPYGAAIGLAAPVLRYFLFGMPQIYPTGVSMMLELAVYGLVSGLLYKRLKGGYQYIYINLIISMLCGRAVWGITMFVISTIDKNSFTWQMFLSGAFINAVPGIICHILLVPAVVIALKRAGYIVNE